MDVAGLKARACAHVDRNAAALEALSRSIHEEPELAYEERHAAGALADAVERAGAAVERGVRGVETAFASTAGDGGPLVAICAEYDALPGIGHGCGHNLIAAASVAAFLATREVIGELRGRVRLVGTPAEEFGSGKLRLLEAGVFEGANAALMFHPGDRDEIDPFYLALSNLEVEFTGKAAHAAAAPSQGINALDAMLLGWGSLSALRLTVRSDARVHGIITDGGQAANIIPERTACRITVRAADNAYLEELKRRVLACFEGAARSTGCTLHHAWAESLDVVRQNGPLAEAFAANAASLGRTLRPRARGVFRGSTDFGNLSTVVPAIHPNLAIATEGTPLHSRDFAAAAVTPRAFETQLVAAKALAMTVVDALAGGDLLSRARKAHSSGPAGP